MCSLCFRRKTRYICDLTGSTFSTDAADAADAAAETGAGEGGRNMQESQHFETRRSMHVGLFGHFGD